MDPRGWGAMPLPCHWLPKSQRSHSHQGITAKFSLCFQIKHPKIQVSLLENIFRGLSQLLIYPKPIMKAKRGLQAQAASCSAARPVKSWAEPLKVWNQICGEMTHQGGNHGIIDEKGHSHLPPARHKQAAPSSGFVFAHLYAWAGPCLQAAQPKRKWSFQDQKYTNHLQHSHQKKRNSEITWGGQSTLRLKPDFTPYRNISSSRSFFQHRYKIFGDLGWATSWCSREHLQTEFSPSWPFWSGFLGQGPSLYTNSTLQKEELYFSEAPRH